MLIQYLVEFNDGKVSTFDRIIDYKLIFTHQQLLFKSNLTKTHSLFIDFVVKLEKLQELVCEKNIKQEKSLPNFILSH